MSSDGDTEFDTIVSHSYNFRRARAIFECHYELIKSHCERKVQQSHTHTHTQTWYDAPFIGRTPSPILILIGVIWAIWLLITYNTIQYNTR